MESLYDKSIETFLKGVISNVCLSRIVVALTEVSSIIDSSEDIPAALRPHVLLTALRILREIESDQRLLDQAYVETIPHPRCGDTSCCLGEVWELPLGYEWLCGDCRRPLFYIRSEKTMKQREKQERN